ncbi:TonB-dependent receptor [Phascolarctobacterium succinatutens]|uniref:TonB-dependent receptor n=2 Tax=Phascolarctobacterium succinatutens TaxID=626940 RepID=UPI0026EA33F7|nr:TonB-dependent receptor [Phascolarctobacterium succinatutens]
MLKNKKALVMSVLCAVASVGFVMSASAETMHGNLDEVVVEGSKDVLPGGNVRTTAKLGVLGDKSVMDIPYSEMSMTAKAVETYGDPSQPLANVLMNNPSIRTSTTSPMYTDFSMRGINMNGNHMMLNGVPSLFYQFTTPPSHIIDRIDITSGPNAGVNGVNMSNNGTNSGATPAPGTINIVTKRATDTPVNRYTQTFSGRGNAGEFIDVGRRFGEKNEWGIRVNAEYMEGGLALPGTEKNEKNIFINMDHRGDNSTTNLLAGYFDLRVNGGQRWFSLPNSYSSIVLPDAPDSKNNYDFNGTTKYVHGYLATLNHEHKLDDTWSYFANMGYSRRSGNKDNQGASIKFDEHGNFVGNQFNQQNEEGKNAYVQFGLKGNLETGAVKHDLALSVDRSWARYWNKSKSYKPNGQEILGNLYDGIIFPDNYVLQSFGDGTPQWEETNIGLTIADTISYGKASMLLAASRKHENFESFTGKSFKNDNILPTYGLTYKPVENMAFYYGHTESFSRGLVVSGNNYTNNGETMGPVKSKQNEIGVKYQNAGMMTTLSYFDIDEANRYDINSNDPNHPLTKVDDGKNRYKGVELTVNGKLADKWTVTGGLLYLDAEREKTKNGTKDGWFVNGASEWSGVLGLEYKPDDSLGIVGRAVWNDKAYIDSRSSSGKTEIPSYVTFDLGVNYKTKINTVPVKLSAMCYNVADKDYWMGRGSSTTIGLSMPRTFMLSAQFDI